MKQSELKARVTEIRAAFDTHASTAPTYADPSWFAHRGYLSAAGNAGAGHLAWERIAPELLQLRATYTRLGRPFKDHELAFVMAYGLGLTDQGTLSHAAADELADAIMPAAREQRPLYRAPVFWMMTLMVILLDISVAVAIASDTPEYPTLSAPLDIATTTHIDSSRESRAEIPTTITVPMAVDHFVAGTGSLSDAMAELMRLSAADRAYYSRQLLQQLGGEERVEFVKALSDIPGPAISTLIRRAYHVSDPNVVMAAVSASVSRGDRMARIALGSLLNHSDERVQIRSLEALALLGSPSEAHSILPALDRQATQLAARNALKSILGVDRGPRSKPWRRYLHRRAARLHR